MARNGINYDNVKQAAVKLLSQGIAPSVQKIREVLGTGSNTTIAEHLKQWRDDYAKKAVHHLPANMPKELISAFEVLWQTAMEQAQNQFSEYKQTLEAEHEKMLQASRDHERAMDEIKEHLAKNSVLHDEANQKMQQLTIELAVATDRLEKNKQQLIEQKQHYEERLSRAYAEKDLWITKQEQWQSEITVLQEKLVMQTEKHQQTLEQQQRLREQSENRWLQLIDQAKQNTLDERKRLERLLLSGEEKNKHLTDQLSQTQQLLHDKSTEFKLVLAQIDQLKEKIKILETEVNGSKAIIIKLEEENTLKNTFIKTALNKQNKTLLERKTMTNQLASLQEKS